MFSPLGHGDSSHVHPSVGGAGGTGPLVNKWGPQPAMFPRPREASVPCPYMMTTQIQSGYKWDSR